MKTKKNVLWVLYGLFMLAFALWLAFSTSWIATASSKTALKETTLESYPLKSYGGFSIQTLAVTDPAIERFTAIGTYFPQNPDFQAEGRMALVLVGERGSYELSLEIDRSEATATVVDNAIFSADVSLLPLKNGIYSIYFCWWDTDDFYGLTDTNYQLRKTSSGIEIFFYPGQQIETLVKPTDETTFIGGIDYARSDGTLLQIMGWGVPIMGQTCDDQVTWVELTDSAGKCAQYTAREELRGDVGAYLGNDIYNESGFFTTIPMSDLADGEYTLRAIIQNGEVIRASIPYVLTKTGETVTFAVK